MLEHTTLQWHVSATGTYGNSTVGPTTQGTQPVSQSLKETIEYVLVEQ